MAIELSKHLVLREELVKSLEEVEWMTVLFFSSSDKRYNKSADTVVNTFPVIEVDSNGNRKAIKDSVDYFQVKLTSISTSKDKKVGVGETIVFNFRDSELGKIFNRMPRVKIKLDRNELDVKVGNYTLEPLLFLDDVQDLSNVGS